MSNAKHGPRLLDDTVVDRSGGPEACWPWIGPIEKLALGRACTWELAHGAIPAGKLPFRMQKCKARNCTNPDHLRLFNDPDAKQWCSDCAGELVVSGAAWRCDRCCIAGSFVKVGERLVRLREFEMPVVVELEADAEDIDAEAA